MRPLLAGEMGRVFGFGVSAQVAEVLGQADEGGRGVVAQASALADLDAFAVVLCGSLGSSPVLRATMSRSSAGAVLSCRG